MSARLTHRLASLSIVGLLSVAVLTGCGSSSSSGTRSRVRARVVIRPQFGTSTTVPDFTSDVST